MDERQREQATNRFAVLRVLPRKECAPPHAAGEAGAPVQMAEHRLARYRQNGLADLARLGPSERPMHGVNCILVVAALMPGPVTLALAPLDDWAKQRDGAGFPMPCLPTTRHLVHASAMFVVTEADAAVIRTAFHEEGELSAITELRQRFPGIADHAKARACVRTIAGWQQLPAAPCPVVPLDYGKRIRRSAPGF